MRYTCSLMLLLVMAGCGSSKPEAPANSGKIVNGTAVSQSDHPQYVKVLQSAGGSYSGCTGTVIGERAVLTAAHCVGSGSVLVQTGGDDGPLLRAGQIYSAAGYGTHPQYGIVDDLALIITEQPLGRPALPLLGSSLPQPGDSVMVAGYGLEDGEHGSYGTLRIGTMIVKEVTPYHIIVEYDGSTSNVCFGDSGGPLVHFIKDGSGAVIGAALAGIVSAGTRDDCKPGDITYFTNVEPFISSLLETVPDAQLQ